MKYTATSVLAVIVLLAGFLIATGSYYTTDAGEQAVVTRFGAISRIEGPGLHFKMPVVESVKKISTRTQTIEWSGHDSMESYSKDQQPAKLSLKVVYHVNSDPQSVSELYTQYRDAAGFASAIIIPRTFEAVKTIFGQFNAVTAIQERSSFNVKVEQGVRGLIKGPVTIEGVQIQDIAYSDEYEKAVEQRMQAQVEVEKIAQNLERERKQAEIKVVQAQAEAEAVRLRGEAEAAAIKARSDALKDSPKLVELTAAEKWDGHLPQTMIPGSTVPFVSVPNGQP